MTQPNNFPTVLNGQPVDGEVWFNAIARAVTALQEAQADGAVILTNKTIETQNNTTTFIDDPELQWTLNSPGHHAFMAQLWISSPAAAGLKIKFNSPNIVNTEWNARWSDDRATSLIFDNNTKVETSAGGFESIRMWGIIYTFAPTVVLILDWAQQTANAGPTFILQGSWFRFQRLTS